MSAAVVPMPGPEATMGVCEVCGNCYARAFVVEIDGQRHTFDSFECAIHALAPRCHTCECRVIGHGLQQDDAIFCSAHCARKVGVHDLVDHA
jgi:hypothetical protein